MSVLIKLVDYRSIHLNVTTEIEITLNFYMFLLHLGAETLNVMKHKPEDKHISAERLSINGTLVRYKYNDRVFDICKSSLKEVFGNLPYTLYFQ